MSEKVTLFSTKCPRCLLLEKRLKEKGITYEENNDVQLMLSKGLEMAPALEIGDKLMGYKEAVKWIGEQ